jgi:hypothetical protein
VALKLKPPPQELVDMHILAEEDRLKTMFQKAKSKEKEKIREALKKIKDMRRSLLRVYFPSMMLGAFKPEFVPVLSSLGRKEESKDTRFGEEVLRRSLRIVAHRKALIDNSIVFYEKYFKGEKE